DDFLAASVNDVNGFNLGDTNHDGILNPDETWLYTSEGVADHQVSEGFYVNEGMVTAQGSISGETVSDTDLNNLNGQTTGEGLTPGFWKNNAIVWDAAAWPRANDGTLIYNPGDPLSSIFSGLEAYGLEDVSLVDALGLNGGGINALMRHSVAALLNATHGTVAYPMTASQVIEATQIAIDSGNAKQINTLKNQWDDYNNYGADLDQHGNTSTWSALTLDASGSIANENVTEISEADLQASLSAALSYWGLADDFDINVKVTDLESGGLGLASGNTILLDRNAAGQGWFVDETPHLNEEFENTDAGLVASGLRAAAQGVDLLSVLVHEIGHLVGFGHDSSEDSVMQETMAAGERRLPDASLSSLETDEQEQSAGTAQGLVFVEQFGEFVGFDALAKFGVTVDGLNKLQSGNPSMLADMELLTLPPAGNRTASDHHADGGNEGNNRINWTALEGNKDTSRGATIQRRS
ncbi:matrixin family metalloprotease, partial [Roseibium sp.]|uniref:matrixin family metalloprotease n=1 Tax=Roseibium sp. TaxID=1936156 RepID=UPI003D152EC4